MESSEKYDHSGLLACKDKQQTSAIWQPKAFRQGLLHVGLMLVVGALMLILGYPTCAAANDKVLLQLKWQHQFQFAGYYAAKEKGYYETAGLDVEILPSQPGEDSAQQVLQGKADFGVGTTDLLVLREQGLPVVALAVIFQHSPLAILALKRNNLQSIHDLAGSKVMIEPGSSELFAYLNKEGISSDKFTLLPHGFSTKDLLAGNVDAMSVYVTDEPFELKKTGQEYFLYSPRSVGIDFYGDNLFTTERHLKENPSQVKAFRDASLKGWEYAMQNPEEIVQLIYSRYSQLHSIDHLRFEADQMVPLLQTVLVEIGHMNPGRWQHIAQTYAELGMMKPNFDASGFLYDPNPPPVDLRWLYIFMGIATLVAAIVSALVVYVFRINAKLRQEAAERKKTGDALRASEEKHRILFRDSPDAYLIVVNGVFVDCKRATEVMLRGDRTQIIGKPPEIISPEFQPDGRRSSLAAEEKIKAALRIGSNTFEWVHRRFDGSDFFVDVSITSMVLDEKPALFTTWRDITERKQAEEQKAKLEVLNRQLQKTDSLHRMAGAIAHTFNNQLGAVIGNLEMAIDDVPQGVKPPENLTAAMQGALKAAEVSGLMLTYLGQTFDKHTPLDLAETCRLSLPRLQAAAPKELILNACLPVHGPTIRANAKQIQQVLTNLVTNAWEAVGEKNGTVNLSVKTVTATDIQAAHRFPVDWQPRDLGYACLEVCDTGCGIVEEDIDKLFDPFFSTKFTGRGLGLPVALGIVKAHDGVVTVESAIERGTTVRVFLPVL